MIFFCKIAEEPQNKLPKTPHPLIDKSVWLYKNIYMLISKVCLALCYFTLIGGNTRTNNILRTGSPHTPRIFSFYLRWVRICPCTKATYFHVLFDLHSYLKLGPNVFWTKIHKINVLVFNTWFATYRRFRPLTLTSFASSFSFLSLTVRQYF
jgi:hypothetical protein